jgi:hypothetical protein
MLDHKPDDLHAPSIKYVYDQCFGKSEQMKESGRCSSRSFSRKPSVGDLRFSVSLASWEPVNSLHFMSSVPRFVGGEDWGYCCEDQSLLSSLLMSFIVFLSIAPQQTHTETNPRCSEPPAVHQQWVTIQLSPWASVLPTRPLSSLTTPPRSIQHWSLQHSRHDNSRDAMEDKYCHPEGVAATKTRWGSCCGLKICYIEIVIRD